MFTVSALRPDLNRPVRVSPRAQPADVAAKARTATPSSDPFGTRRFTCSKATTIKGHQQLANDISRQLIGIPFTRRQEDAIRAEKKGLTPQEIDPNAYRQSKRRYAPRDTRKRHPGWVKYQFILPKRLVEGLVVLTKMKAEQHAAERTEQPYGFRRRCAKGKSSFVAEAINRLLAENGLSEFCVD